MYRQNYQYSEYCHNYCMSVTEQAFFNMATEQERLQQSTLLVYGYSRRIQRILTQTIPTSVIALFFDYFYLAHPNSYSWNITDKSLIQRMKNETGHRWFRGPIFSAFAFKWRIVVAPNGHKSANINTVSFMLELVSIPPKIREVKMNWKSEFVSSDGNYKYEKMSVFSSNRFLVATWDKSMMSTEEFRQFQKFEFIVYLELIHVHSTDNDDITSEYQKTGGNRLYNKTDNDSSLDIVVMKLDEIMNKISSIEQRVQNIELKMNHFEQGKDEILQEIKSIKQQMIPLQTNIIKKFFFFFTLKKRQNLS